MYVEVSIPIALFKTFTYNVPKNFEKNIFLGQSVKVSFNKKEINGFITQIKQKAEYQGKLLNISSINSDCFFITDELWKTVRWISKYYICPIGKVLNNTLSYQHKRKYLLPINRYVTITSNGRRYLSSVKYNLQKEILRFLNEQNTKVDLKDLKIISKSYTSICKKLNDKGYIKVESKVNIDGILKPIALRKSKLVLNKNQNNIFNSLIKSWRKNYLKPALISGISGSGKTIVYIKTIEHFLKQDKEIIVLVPEISQINQTYKNLNNFYPNKVGIWHSKLKQTEKNYVLHNINSKKIKIIVSTRSGLFMPFQNLGLIIINEEQDASYKQELNSPFYHSRDVALMRSKFNKNSLLLISSVPSIETYYNVKNNKYSNYWLENNNSKIPNVELVAMEHQKGMLSKTLITKIQDRLNKKEQIILLQNKKGLIGSGTQKVEDILYKIFPDIKILRYDRDTLNKTSKYYSILNDFREKKADLLLGTQMVAKGLDFKNVSLVGIINADIGLSLPDFRAEEKIFQLIYQLIGRTGQHHKFNDAVIQSYNTDNYYIRGACSFKLEKCYTSIIDERKELYYPPYSRLIKILFIGRNKDKTKKKSKKIFSIFQKNKNIQILGPSLAPIEKINDAWRYQILIKCKKDYWQKFHDWINNNISLSEFENSNSNINIKLDVDCISIL